MAVSGIVEKKIYSGIYLKFEWVLSSQTIYGNSSIINWDLKIEAAETSTLSASVLKNCKVVFDGNETSAQVDVNISGGETKTVLSGFEVANHSLNGEKSCAFSFEIDFGGNIGVIKASHNAVLPTIVRQATITSAWSFDDSGNYKNPAFWFSNPAGEEVDKLECCISTDGTTATIPYREISKDRTSYTFILTEAELNTLRNSFPSTDSGGVYYLLKTTINGDTYVSSLLKNFNILDAEPLLNPTVIDTGSVSKVLTGDTSVMILDYNMMQVAFNASAQKGASITSKKVTCGGDTLTDDGTFRYASSNVFIFSVTDSRGKTTTKTITVNAIDYIKLTCNFKSVTFPTTSSITFNVKGNYYNGSFGAKSNSLTVKYRYKETGGTYSSFISMTPNINGNTYTASATLNDLDYSKNYVIQVQYDDECGGARLTEEKTVSCTPVFDWSKSDFNFNVPINFNGIGNVLRRNVNSGGIILSTADANSTQGIYLRPKGTSNTENQLILNPEGKLTVNGALNAQSATLSGALKADKAILTNDLTAVNATLSGAVNAASGTITTLTANNATINEDLTVTEVTKTNGLMAEVSLLTDNICGTISCGSINGYYFGSQECLWSGAYYMNDAQTIDLSETPLSAQPHGIILLFSRYDASTNTAQDSGFNCFFVPKIAVSDGWYSDCSFAFNMFTSQFNIACCKKLYITDTEIRGSADNSNAGTGTSGIKYDNKGYVLREVIGV